MSDSVAAAKVDRRPPLPPDFVDQLARVLYTPERVERAAHYARSRGLDPARFQAPWVMTDSDPGPFEFLRRWGRSPRLYIDCLFVPVIELRYDPAEVRRTVLAGFDIRYCGPRPDRAKYTKVKRDAQSVMLYNIHEALRIHDAQPEPWMLLVESAIDAETLRLVQLPGTAGPVPVVGALTALGTPAFATLLHSLFERIFVMYDNDKGGASATSKLLAAAAQGGPAVKAAFRPVIYSGGDANEALTTLGLDTLRRAVLGQVGL